MAKKFTAVPIAADTWIQVAANTDVSVQVMTRQAGQYEIAAMATSGAITSVDKMPLNGGESWNSNSNDQNVWVKAIGFAATIYTFK